MPFNGTGIFTPLITFVDNTLATAEDQNSQDIDIASGLTDCMTRDGQAPATANISLGGFRINNVGTGTATTDAVNLSQLSALLPTGVVLPFAGTSVPGGFLLCYGQAVSRSTYAVLFGVIGTTYGSGDSTTTYNLPDFRGIVAAGADNMGGVAANNLTGYVVGSVGGDQYATLSTTNLPAHNHTVTDPGHTHTVTDPGHVHGPLSPNTSFVGENSSGPAAALGSGTIFNPGVATTASAVTGITNASNTTGITTQNTGSGTHFFIVQPTLAINYMIKT